MKCPVEITPKHLVYDRSRTTTDWDCPRKRYWQYEHEGTGVTPEVDAKELFTGTVIHTAMAALANGQLAGAVPIDEIAETTAQSIYTYHVPNDEVATFDTAVTYGKEQAALIYGLIKGFYQHSWPTLMEKYDIVSVEEEMFFIHDQHGKGTLDGSFIMMVKPDLVLRDKTSKDLVYLEYKSTSSKREGWVAQWEDAVQLHSTINAIEQSLGERPTCAIVQGLYKGYESYGKQSSPFCYAYFKQGYPPFSTPEYSYEYRNGLRRVATWEMEGGTKQWVENMPANVLADQFPQTPPIFPNDDLIIDYFQQRAMRELEIQMARQVLASNPDETSRKVVLNGAFPQRFDRCKPPYGNAKPCQNRLLCHGGCDPIQAGFAKREPHHDLEIEQRAKNSTPPQQYSANLDKAEQTQEEDRTDSQETANPISPEEGLLS